MKFKTTIDPLLLFLVGSILMIFSLWSCNLIDLTFAKTLDLRQEIDFESNVNIEDESISVLNPDFELYTSTDGGDNFEKVDDNFNFSELRIKNLTKYQNSWRDRSATGGISTNESGIFVLVDPEKNVRSNAYSYSKKDRSKSLPQINLIISEDDLYGEMNGFYTLGMTSWAGKDYTKAWWERPANYKERGPEWTKKGFFEFQNLAEHKRANVKYKISGNATRGFPQKSFKIYGDKSLGSEFINMNFGQSDQKKYESLVLRNSGNDNTRTLFADLLMHNLASKSELIVQAGIQTVVFVNGNYWGIYNLRERLSVENLAIKFDVKLEKVTILENGAGELKDGDELAYENFQDFITKLENDLLSYEEIKEVISIKSFIDYVFFETYFANQDWPSNNSMFYKVKGKKWKWILNDLDYSLAYPGSQNLDADIFEKLKSSNSVTAKIFNALIKRTEFVKKFKERIADHLSSTVNAESVKKEYDFLKSNIQSEVNDHSVRWRQFTCDEWENSCQKNLEFLLNRTPIYITQIEGF